MYYKKKSYIKRISYFETNCKCLIAILSRPTILISFSTFLNWSKLKLVRWGFNNSIQNGLPRPNVRTSTSSLPDAENLGTEKRNNNINLQC